MAEFVNLEKLNLKPGMGKVEKQADLGSRTPQRLRNWQHQPLDGVERMGLKST